MAEVHWDPLLHSIFYAEDSMQPCIQKRTYPYIKLEGDLGAKKSSNRQQLFNGLSFFPLNKACSCFLLVYSRIVL